MLACPEFGLAFELRDIGPQSAAVSERTMTLTDSETVETSPRSSVSDLP